MMVDWTDPSSVRDHIKDIVRSRKDGGAEKDSPADFDLKMILTLVSTVKQLFSGGASGEDDMLKKIADDPTALLSAVKAIPAPTADNSSALVAAIEENTRTMRECFTSLESAFMSETSLVSDDKGKRAVRTKK